MSPIREQLANAHGFICQLEPGDVVPFDASPLKGMEIGYIMQLLDELRADGVVVLTDDVVWVRTELDV